MYNGTLYLQLYATPEMVVKLTKCEVEVAYRNRVCVKNIGVAGEIDCKVRGGLWWNAKPL